MKENIELQFLVLPEQKVHFKVLHQGATTYVDEIRQDFSIQAKLNALKYRYPLKYLGKQCEELTVLCIPATEHSVNHRNNGNQSEKQLIPKLIKIDQSTELQGFRSGRRSAILFWEGKMIRYKGCGNDTEGFVYENKQLRGSHFYHTAKRQLYMTNHINSILKKAINEPSANTPLHFYEFTQEIQKYGLKNQIQLLGKYCCVFETKGDRRLGTHLISPLEILFLNLIDFTEKKAELEKHFKEKERIDTFDNGLVELLIDFQFQIKKEKTFIESYSSRKQFTNYVDLNTTAGNQSDLLQVKKNLSLILDKISKKFIKNQPDSKRLIQLFQKPFDCVQIIGIILQKIGYEMGRVKRIFCEQAINWGFFNDHGYFHCNAHLNNFIVRQPDLNNKNFILPLDFDLAFTKQQYMNIEIHSENYGQNDSESFQQLLLAEYNAMEMSISGLEIMNFQYSIEGKQEEQTPREVKMGRIVFRDTIIKAFRQGMEGNGSEIERINVSWGEKLPEIRKVIEACLMISSDFQT